MRDKIWTSQNGRQTKIKDMNTKHIENTLAKLKREGFVSAKTHEFYMTCNPPTGEMALEAFEAESDEILNSPINDFIDDFEEELKYRQQQTKEE